MATRKSTGQPKTAKRSVKKAVAPRRKTTGRQTAAKPARPQAAKAAGAKTAPARPPRARPEALRLRAFSPGLTVGDLEKSIEFYTQALGFVVVERWMREGQLSWVLLKAGACELGLSRDDWARGRERRKGEGFRLYAETHQGIDELAARARARGARITQEPADMSWGARAFSFDDPDGFHWTIHREAGG